MLPTAFDRQAAELTYARTEHASTGDRLLAVHTRIYVEDLLRLIDAGDITGAAKRVRLIIADVIAHRARVEILGNQ